jgi:hypothetical protein
MRSSYTSVSSERRVSSWLLVLLGLAAYVGLIFGLTMLPLQIEVDLPHWGALAVPPVVYGLLVLLSVRRPSVVRWIIGTAVLSGFHVLLGFAREPLTALLDPALVGRPLPWMLPPPLPELIGVVFLLMPLRDLLRAPARPARERSGAANRAGSSRGRAVPPTRSPQAAPAETGGSLSDVLLPARSEPTAEPVVVAPVLPTPAPAAEPRRRRAAKADPRHAPEPTPAMRRSDVVLRIALDRIMAQLPPGTFLAPEDEVAASLPVPGYLLIPGQLVVTQLAEGVASVAWSDIVDQFPPSLVGLGSPEISEHLHDGLKLPIDEVIGQLPHDIFVADTPEVEMSGLDRIPVPFHPLEGSSPAPGLLAESTPDAAPARPVERARVASSPPALPAPPAELRPDPIPAPSVSAAAPPRTEPVPVAAAEPVRAAEPAVSAAASVGAAPDESMVRISFGRVASELPAEGFRVPVEALADRMREPGLLLVPQSLVLPQLAEGLIRVSWSVVASQFPHDQMTGSDGEMVERLPDGIQLPLDEVIRQLPTALFATGGAAVDVRGLENFPAPFQPFVSDPAPAVIEPEPVRGPVVTEVVEVVTAAPEEPPIVAAPEVVEESPGQTTTAPESGIEAPFEIEPARPADLNGRSVLHVDPEPAPLVVEPEVVSEAAPMPVPVSGPASSTRPIDVPREIEPEPVIVEPEHSIENPRLGEPVVAWPPTTREPMPLPSPAGSAEAAEARRLTALLSPIGSFDVSVQVMEGVTVYALASPTVSHETTMAAAGLALPLLTDRRTPWALDQLTLRGPDTTVVLTPLGGPSERGPVLAAAAPRGGALALLEILSRRAASASAAAARGNAPFMGGRGLAEGPPPARAMSLAASLNAFGAVSASVRRDAAGESVVYFFLPPSIDSLAAGHLAQDLQALMRKASGSGAVFRTAVLRSGDMLLVFQPEEIGHGRSIVVVAGGEVTRPGLAYRQVERAAAALAQA